MRTNLKTQGLFLLLCLMFFMTEVKANVLGTDAQNFNTITNGLDFVTVHSSETLEPGILNLGLFGNYSQNTFSYLGKARDGSKRQDGMSSADFNVGLGVGRNFDVGLSFPFLINAWDNGGAQSRIILENSGLTEVRANAKYRLTGDKSGGVAVVGSIGSSLIDNNPYAGTGAGPTYNFELVGDTTLGKVGLGANAGYRLRTPGKKLPGFSIDPLGDQFIASGAINYLLSGTSTKLIGEIFGSWPADKISQNTDRTQTTFEWIAGVKQDVSQQLALHAGGGTKLANGFASPDWRVYVGLNYVFGPLFGEPKPLIRKVKPDFSYETASEEIETVTPFWTEPTEMSERFVADEIIFGFNSDRIVNEGAKEALKQFADHAKKSPLYVLVVVEGHTDSIGRDAYNQDLSQRRADNIKKYLAQYEGIDAKKVKSVGYGETHPIADNGNFQGRARNRRVEFRVYRAEDQIPLEYRD